MASLIKYRFEKTLFNLEITTLTLESIQLAEKVEIIIKIKKEKNLFKKFGVWIYSKAMRKI